MLIRKKAFASQVYDMTVFSTADAEVLRLKTNEGWVTAAAIQVARKDALHPKAASSRALSRSMRRPCFSLPSRLYFKLKATVFRAHPVACSRRSLSPRSFEQRGLPTTSDGEEGLGESSAEGVSCSCRASPFGENFLQSPFNETVCCRATRVCDLNVLTSSNELPCLSCLHQRLSDVARNSQSEPAAEGKEGLDCSGQLTGAAPLGFASEDDDKANSGIFKDKEPPVPPGTGLEESGEFCGGLNPLHHPFVLYQVASSSPVAIS